MNRKSGLGRGLDSLLPASDTRDGLEAAGSERLPIESIAPNPRQPRQTFQDEKLTELAASIRELGILQPLLVRRGASGFELIAGERRLRAARLAGLDSVPVVVVDTDDRGSLERALVENIHRADLNPIEEAAAYKQLIDEGGLTQEALGSKLGRNRVTITNALRLLELPASIQRLLIDERITSGHGKVLLGVTGSAFQDRIARRAADEGLSVRDTEEIVKRFNAMTPGGRREVTQAPAALAEAQRALSDHLQTRVRVEMGKRKGKIILDFVSTDDLDRLLTSILGPDPSGTARVTPD
jgi:ParB family chromosome partitioning protein